MNPKKQIQKKVINAATFKYEDISQKNNSWKIWMQQLKDNI